MTPLTTLPAALAPLGALRQWVTYRLTPQDGNSGKFDKQPCNWQTGGVSNPHEPSNWTTFETAAAHAHLADRGNGCGVGFVLSPGDPFWFVDIDNCLTVENQWSSLATTLCHRLAGAAIEVSQSGRGLHIIGSGVVPSDHRCKNIPLGLELYTERRFIAITGRQTSGSVSAECTSAINEVVAEWFAPVAVSTAGPLNDWTNEPCEGWAGPVDDDDLIRRARASKPKLSAAAALRPGSAPAKATFEALWTADANELAAAFPSNKDLDPFDRSSADASLAMHLAFWTGRDCERIERLMRLSGLMRDKYERQDYMERTVMGAASRCDKVCQDKPVAPPPPPIEVSLTGRGEPRTLSLPGGALEDKQNHLAVEYWLAGAGFRVAYDEFADNLLLNDEPLTTNTERAAWFAVREISGLKISKDLFGEVLRDVAWANKFHPLKEWLASTEPSWDGVKRIDTWLVDYLNVPDSAFVRAIGSIFLTAAVRRIREPGAKFDEILVLEGPQGLEKSSAVAALSPVRDWFTDNFTVSMNAKELLEQTMGKWLVEAPELSKLRDAQVEHVKHLLSRQFDRARMAYDKVVTDRGRHWVGFATVNSDRYLTDTSGNRRFWPVKCGRIDLMAIYRDRAQLWAEAAQRESQGGSIRLPSTLWADAAAEQQARMVVDPFTEVLAPLMDRFETGRVRSEDLWTILAIPADRRQHAGKHLGEAMRGLGWNKKRLRDSGELCYWYVKGSQSPEIIMDVATRVLQIAAPRLTVVP